MSSQDLEQIFRESGNRINQIARGEFRDRMETQPLGEGVWVGVRKEDYRLVESSFPRSSAHAT